MNRRGPGSIDGEGEGGGGYKKGKESIERGKLHAKNIRGKEDNIKQFVQKTRYKKACKNKEER